MKLNKKALEEARRSRADAERVRRARGIEYLGFWIVKSYRKWIVMKEGRRGFLLPTGIKSALLTTVVYAVEEEHSKSLIASRLAENPHMVTEIQRRLDTEVAEDW